MASEPYCRHCEDEVASCLSAAREQVGMRAYFLNLAWRWRRLAADIESRQACGDGCPLRKTCTAAHPPAGDDTNIVEPPRRDVIQLQA